MSVLANLTVHKMTTAFLRRGIAVGLLAVLSGASAAQTLPTDSAVRAIVMPRVDTGRYAGIAVGLVSRDGRQQVTTYGPNAGVTPFDSSTVFEIGSITKTFTAAILAEMSWKLEVGAA